jgi:hypothetical protein
MYNRYKKKIPVIIMGFRFFSFEGRWRGGDWDHFAISYVMAAWTVVFLSAMALCWLRNTFPIISLIFFFFSFLFLLFFFSWRWGDGVVDFPKYPSLSTFVERQRSWHRELRRGR